MAPDHALRMLTAEEARRLMESAAIVARTEAESIGPCGSATAMLLRPTTFVNVLRSPIGPQLIQWRQRGDLRFAPYYGELEIVITTESYSSRRQNKIVGPIGRTLLPGARHG